jgi:hypothetical protein
VPAFLPQIRAPTAAEPPDFAKWLFKAAAPTARVIVNCWWAMLFGTGLVN